MKNEDLINKVKARTIAEASKRILPMPSTQHKLDIVEAALGFLLPQTLKEMYLNVSNGHFGPGIGGIFCLPDHSISFLEHSLIEWYFGFRCDREIGKPEWPTALLPLCEWGDSIYSAVDCAQIPSPIVRVDHNLDISWVEQRRSVGSSLILFEPYSNKEVVSWIEANSLDRWLENWANGHDLFHNPYEI